LVGTLEDRQSESDAEDAEQMSTWFDAAIIEQGFSRVFQSIAYSADTEQNGYPPSLTERLLSPYWLVVFHSGDLVTL
jgi:hypothetical protein